MPQIERILQAAQKEPWAILPEKLEEISCFLARRANGPLPEEEVAAFKTAQAAPKPSRRTPGGVMVLPVRGTIMPRADWLMDFSGGTSLQALKQEVRKAAADPDIKAIVLDIDSPVGS